MTQPRSVFNTRGLAGIITAFGRDESGVIAVVLAIMLAAIIGVMALAVDLGRAWNLQTELQNAADAAALAGATQLDNKPEAIFRARLAAETSVDALSENRQRFATDSAGWAVVITAPDIRFLQSLNPRIYVDEDDVDADYDAEFIEVTIAPRRVDFMFAAVVGAVASASPSGMAVAGLGQAVCLVPPIMICNPNEPDPNNSDPDAPFIISDYTGAGILLKAAGNGTAWKPGNFGLLALSNKSLSTNDIRDAMGRYPPLELCFGESVGTKPGQSTAVRQGLNMRFDMYSGVAGGLETETAYRPSRNPVKGLIKGSQCMWGGQGWKHPDNRYAGHLNPGTTGLAFNGDPTDPTLAGAMGFPRDKCSYPAPDGPDNCDLMTSGARFGDGEWDIATYMWINHGIPLDPILVSTLNTTTLGPHQYLDFNGDGRVTRHDVYLWELSIEMPAGPLSSYTEEESSEVTMQCATEGMPEETEPDRRELVIAVLNCNYHEVKGATPDVPVLMWVKLFMTEPMGTYESNNDLYAEFVGPADMGIVGRNVVQLYE